MGTVRLWLSVYEKRTPMGENSLWTREMTTDFAPREGDMLHLSVNDDGEDDVSCYVRRSYWNHDGLYNCTMQDIVIDPADDMFPGGSKHWTAWWRDRESVELEPMLRKGGWITWEEWEAARLREVQDV